MTSDEIITFISLAKTKNFSKTADILFASQSTISARIKTLEAQIGQPLFIRDTKNVELTPAGISFLNYAMEINRLIEESKRSSKAMGRYNSRISIAAPESYWNNILFPALDDYFESNKNIAFDLKCLHSEAVLSGILANQNDLGIICFYIKHPDLQVIPLKESSFVLTSSPDLKLPEFNFSPDTFDLFPFINMDFGDIFNEWLQKTYYTGIYALDTEKMFMFLRLLLSGKGLGFLPARIASPYLSSGQLIKIPYAFHEQAPHEFSYLVFPKKKYEYLCPLLHALLSYAKNMD